MRFLIAILILLAMNYSVSAQVSCPDQCLEDAANLAQELFALGHSEAEATQLASQYYQECVRGCPMLATALRQPCQTDFSKFTQMDYSLANWHYPPLEVTGNAKILRDLCTHRTVSLYECLKGLSEGKPLPALAAPVPWLDWRDGKYYSFGVEVKEKITR